MREPYHYQDEQLETIHVYLFREEAYQPEAETIIDQAPTPTKQPPTALGVVVCLFGVFLTLGSLTFSLLLAFNPGLIPPTINKQIDKTITLTLSLYPTATQVQSYLLPEIRATKQREVPATGIVHQSAAAATGLLTFYNGAFTAQVVPAETVLQGKDGISVSTDQQAVIPPATPTTPPTYETVSASPHSTITVAA